MKLNQLILCLLSFSVYLNLASPVAEPTSLAVRDDWLGDEVEETGKDDQEKAEFVNFINVLLWGDESSWMDEDTEVERQYRGYQYDSYGTAQPDGRWRGLLRRPMPNYLRQEGSLARSFYDQFTDSCYSLGCFLGINRLVSQLGRVIG